MANAVLMWAFLLVLTAAADAGSPADNGWLEGRVPKFDKLVTRFMEAGATDSRLQKAIMHDTKAKAKKVKDREEREAGACSSIGSP